ncbi:MAG: hypothetical protein OXI33_13875 [Chloroflexota bacterium]|nr:hypothetical protein [Chloroflexota bacterium]
MLRRLLPPGLRPLGHRRDLLRQCGQVMVVEDLDVRVRRGLLHADGGPVPLDGDDDLQVLRRIGLRLGVGLVSSIGTALRVLRSAARGVLLNDDSSGPVVGCVGEGPLRHPRYAGVGTAFRAVPFRMSAI